MDFGVDCLRILQVVVVLALVKTSLWLWNYWICSCRDESNPLPLPPGDSGIPIFGETLAMVWNMIRGEDFYDKKRSKYGCIYRTHLFGAPTIRITGTEAVYKILHADRSTISFQSPATIRRLLGQFSIVNTSGQEHKTKRKGILRAFHRQPLETYVSTMETHCWDAIARWCEEENVLAFSSTRRLAFTVALEILVGGDISNHNSNFIKDVVNDLEIFFKGFWTFPMAIPGSTFAKALEARERLRTRLKHQVYENQNSTNEDNSSTALYHLLAATEEDNNNYSIEDAVIELLFASVETLTSSLTSTLLCLGQNEGVVERIRDELKQYDLFDAEQTLSYSQLLNLDFTQRVCREILYKCPPAGAVFRKVEQTFELNGYQIPRGWTIMAAIKDSHDASPLSSVSEVDFDPDRWLKRPSKDQFLTFGDGPRSCVGKEYAKLLLSVFVVCLVRSCDWEVVNPNPKMLRLPSLRPNDGLPITIKRVVSQKLKQQC